MSVFGVFKSVGKSVGKVLWHAGRDEAIAVLTKDLASEDVIVIVARRINGKLNLPFLSEEQEQTVIEVVLRQAFPEAARLVRKLGANDRL